MSAKAKRQRATVRRAKEADAEGIANLIETGEFLVGSREELMREIEEWNKEQRERTPAA